MRSAWLLAGASASPIAFPVLMHSGRSSPRLMNCYFLNHLFRNEGSPLAMATGWDSWEKDAGCEIGGSTIGLILGRWSVAGLGRLPTAGKVARGCVTNWGRSMLFRLVFKCLIYIVQVADHWKI